MTVLKSKISAKDKKFINNQKQVFIDYKLTQKAVEMAIKLKR